MPRSHHKQPPKTPQNEPEKGQIGPQNDAKEANLPLSPVSPTFGEKADSPESAPARPFPPRESDTGGPIHRVSLKIVDGKIAIDDLQDRTRNTIKEAIRNSLNDPHFVEFAGLSALPGSPTGTVVPPEDAKFFLQVQATLITAWASLKLKVPWEQAWARINWSEAEHALLDPKLATVMTKYFPEELKANLDWITFLGMWGSMSILHWGAITRYVEDQKKLGKTSPPVVMSPKEETPAPVVEQPAKPNGDGATVEQVAFASVSGL